MGMVTRSEAGKIPASGVSIYPWEFGAAVVQVRTVPGNLTKERRAF